MQYPTDPIDRAIQVLNEALDSDPAAINQLMSCEVLINTTLTVHPTIQVGKSHQRPDRIEYVLRPLGLINGLFGVDEDTYGFIAARVGEDGKIEGFERLDKGKAPGVNIG